MGKIKTAVMGKVEIICQEAFKNGRFLKRMVLSLRPRNLLNC